MAVHAVPVPADADALPLNDALRWQLTPRNALEIDELLAPEAHANFARHRGPNFNRGFVGGDAWFYFPLQYTPGADDAAPDELQRYLYIDYPHLDRITAYLLYPDGRRVQHHLGDALPFDQRPVATNRFAIPVTLPAGEAVKVYLHVATNSALQMPVHLLSPSGLLQRESSHWILFSLYYGMMLVMVLYNLAVHYFFRDRSYLYFALHVASFALLQATINGHAFQYLWPDHPQWTDVSVITLIALVAIFSLQLVRSFLHTRQQLPVADRLLQATTLAALAIGGLSLLLNYRDAIILSIFLTVFASAAIIACSFISYRRGYRSAGFFLAGWLTMLPAACIHALQTAHLIPVNLFTANAALLGSVGEVILLSLALADRFRQIREQNRQLEQRSRQQLQASNRDLQRALAKVEESNRLKDEFLATISHELRTPMNGVEGALELLRSDNLSPDQRYYIDSAKVSARDMTRLIEAILRFSEIQAGQLNVKQETFEVRPVLNRYAVEFRQQCQQKGLQFNWQIDKAVPQYIESDADQIVLILRQLIDNAVKFTDSGEVSVTLLRDWDEAKRVDSIVFAVQDTGRGIPVDKLQTIFDVFRQLDGSHSRLHNGLGIGLTICHRLVTLMGGSLRVDSTPGAGTTVKVVLPLRKVTQLFVDESEISHSFHDVAHKTVLVIEDNPVNQMVLRNMLQQLGCLVVTASNGAQGLEALQTHPIDLIMMDCQMPVMDGFETTRRIRSSYSSYRDVPIIAVTANAMSNDSGRCFAAGMNDYIKKPIQRDVVERKVKRWLANRISTAI